MVSLKLKGPKRPVNDRKYSSTSKSSAGSDTSRVLHDSQSTSRRTSSLADHATPAVEKMDEKSNVISKKRSAPSDPESDLLPPASNSGQAQRNGGAETTRPMLESATRHPASYKGKAPVHDDKLNDADSEMLETDDVVEEYDFSNEPEDDDTEDDDGQDTESYKNPRNEPIDVITISSDDEMEDQFQRYTPFSRPWKEMDEKARYQWEMMYSHVADKPMGGEWGRTEDFQREKDHEMMRYIEDFPLSQWVVPKAVANEAYERLRERIRWRSFGIRIYGRERIPHWMPDTTQPRQSNHGDMPSSSRHPNGGAPLHPHHVHTVPNGVPVETSSHNRILPSQPLAQATMSLPSNAPIWVASSPDADRTMPPPRSTLPPRLSGAASVKQKGKAKRAGAMNLNSPPPEPLAPQLPAAPPPYEVREKPSDSKSSSKPGRRRHAEAEGFPWNRQIDFEKARANATWDDTIYDQRTLDNMQATRTKNEPIMERIDADEQDRQKQARLARKGGSNVDGSSDTERRKSGRKSSILSGAEGGTGDPYHSGHYCFATPEDEEKSHKVWKSDSSPTAIIQAAENDEVALDACKDIMICWNPGKKGVTQDLEQASFSVRDTLVTRQQIEKTDILTRRAAECIVDFCPDLLWRGMLLRIASEAGYGNKEVRDRMCLNGNYCDKATITKRIGSALGQKQQQSVSKTKKKDGPTVPAETSSQKVKGYAKGEDEYYNNNVIDFGKYVEYFGKRVSHRGHVSFRHVGHKRKAVHLGSEDFGESSGSEHSRAKIGVPGSETTASPEPDPIHNPDGFTNYRPEPMDEDDSIAEAEDDKDAVSIQSDTLLDEMDDD